MKGYLAGLCLAMLDMASMASIQDASIFEQVRAIVDERYSDAPEVQRQKVAERLTRVICSRATLSQERIQAIIGRLSHSMLYVRSHVSPYDVRSQGDTTFPALPESLRARQYEAELRWLETYYQKGIDSDPLPTGTREAIARQVDYVLGACRDTLLGHVTGPYAHEAIEHKLRNIRQHLMSTFDSPVTANSPRLMSADEVSALFAKIKDVTGRQAKGIEVLQSMRSLQEAMTEEVSGPEARERKSELVRKYNAIANALDEATRPLWAVLDLWNPELVNARTDLERLSKEVQAWRIETINRLNRNGPPSEDRGAMSVTSVGEGRVGPPSPRGGDGGASVETDSASNAEEVARRKAGSGKVVVLSVFLAGLAVLFIIWRRRRNVESV